MTPPSRAIPAFTPTVLAGVRQRLIMPTLPPTLPPHSVTTTSSNKVPVEAAVLIPLLNIDERPHVLMEVRNKGMRVHAGEASFPGGKADATDDDLIHTALREAHEELSLPSENVEILGRLDPEYSLGNKTRVWPFVGFIHSTPPPFSSTSPLRSLPLSSLKLSPDEVSALLPLPLSVFSTKDRLSTHYFRLDVSKPYHKILCDDLVLPPSLAKSDARSTALSYGPSGDDGVAGESVGQDNEGLEVWGLSGWFLNRLAERVGWAEMPPKGQPPED